MSTKNSVTQSRPFGNVTPSIKMFAVQQGVPVVDSLEYAACLLNAASTQVRAAADAARDVDDENCKWAIYYLLESVEALLGSSIEGLRSNKQ